MVDSVQVLEVAANKFGRAKRDEFLRNVEFGFRNEAEKRRRKGKEVNEDFFLKNIRNSQRFIKAINRLGLTIADFESAAKRAVEGKPAGLDIASSIKCCVCNKADGTLLKVGDGVYRHSACD